MGPVLTAERLEVSVALSAMSAAAPYLPANKEIKLSSFMPRWDPEAPLPDEQSAEEIIDVIRSLEKKDYGDS